MPARQISKIFLLSLTLASFTLFGLDDWKEAKNRVMHCATTGKLEVAWDDEVNAMRFTSSFGERLEPVGCMLGFVFRKPSVRQTFWNSRFGRRSIRKAVE